MNPTVVLTFTYPAVKPFFDDFLKSMNSQTTRNFDLIIVNDGMKDVFDCVGNYPKLNSFIVNCENTPAKNREYGLRLIKQKGYKYCILADSDDFFTDNRVVESVRNLQDADIVVNDLTITDSKGTILVDNYFSKRLEDGYIISYGFLKNKNILGFSNTAFKTEYIDSKIVIPENLKIVDWYFYTLLLYKGCKAIFTSRSSTRYRQSDNNIIGISNVSEEIYRNRYLLKREHYHFLSVEIPEIKDLLSEYGDDDESFNRHFNKFKTNHIKYPFWWEDI